MDKPYVVYGAKRSGSVAVEAALTLIGAPYEVIEAPPWDDPDQQAKIGSVNPLGQVPALVLPSGELMTESAAMLILLADRHPEAGLAPAPDDPRRPAYLRWMVYVPAAIYSLYWIRDEPSRIAEDEAARAVVLERTGERIAACWRMMDAQVSPGRYILGDQPSVLDLYVAVVSRWSPRRERFTREAPKMAKVVRRIDAEPRLAALWATRFPFEGVYGA